MIEPTHPPLAVDTCPPVLFVDLDGTVRKGVDELGRFVNTPDDVEVFPEAAARLREWRARGGVAIGVTNQGGIALGYMTGATNELITLATVTATGDQLDQVLTCPHAPDAECWCRKPSPGLLFQGAAWAAAHFGPCARERCLMVGDMETDRQAAEAARVPFQWATEWRAGR